ncbi:HelD family protein [Amnibacterium kyonggiense]|uniref:DNA helicase IV n=1 Tax=Amnibacterium kyonggiense TaxID=595671 RepID=A0A4R7FIY9_9MICO|nr:AAA family ATPase [Amnibacterium kyonggiense]TDS75692.1 DNA helicase IV [Amnibacterium kyonggiense]
MTDVADAELAREQRYVAGLYSRLDVLRAELVAELERVRRGGATGTHQARTERDAMARLFEDRVRRLRDVDERLVFGRLQADDGAVRYIGRIGLRDDEQQPLLLDWRAPQSSAFYQATAATPLGVRVRRHLTTRGRDVTALEDEVFDPEDIPEDVTLTGETALLAALTAQRTGRMHDIVSTIQAEQDRIIRSESRGVLVVQGGPGTGKTAVALHRAAYLLYAHKERLARNGVLVVGPSRSFLEYIEQVLPSLGETGVVLRTLGQLYPGVDAAAVDAPAVADVKGRSVMAAVIRRAVLARQTAPERPVDVEINGVTLTVQPAVIQRAIRHAQQTRKPHNVARVTFVKSALGELTAQLVEQVAARGSTIDDEDRRMLREDIRTAQDVKVLLNTAWLPLTPEKLLGDLYTRPEYLARSAPELRPHERELLARPRRAPFTVGDVPLLDEAAELLGDIDVTGDARAQARAAQRQRDIENAEQAIANMGVEGLVSAESLADGFAEEGARLTTAERAAVDRTWTYGHIVVDEAQELTPMQWRLLRRRGPLRSFTVVGDLAQSAAVPPAADWRAALGALTDEFRLERLSVNYRTPQAIAELAESRALRDGLPITPSRSVREGEPPASVRTRTDRVPTAVVDAVAADRARGDGGALAVIAPAGQVRALHDALVAGVDDRVGYGAQGLGAPVSVLDPWTAKGLEFDSVVVVDPDRIAAEAGPGSLYVAFTRPTRRLVVVEPTA